MANLEYTLDDLKKEVKNEQIKNEVSKKMQLIVFKLGSEEYALSIDQIKEVVTTPKIAKMPQLPHYIKGVANIRGNIIAIFDLEQKLGMKDKSDENFGLYTLVLESEIFKVGILVKEVPNTLTINVSDIDKAAHFMQFTTLNDNSIIGVVKSNERIIILIDIIKLIENEEIKELENKI